MVDLFPTDPKRIRERIRRCERALKRELEEGYGGDGYGKRFLLGPLYMLMGDVDGALASFDWYEGAYPTRRRRPVPISDLGTGTIPRWSQARGV